MHVSAKESARNENRASTETNESTLRCPGCNLVLINIDLLRADYVGLIEPGRGLTPNIDRFFADGLIFEDVSSGSGATYLSATATATGTETMLNTHGIWNIKPGGGSWRIPWIIRRDGRVLVDRLPTLAETLQENGYHTIAVNDWIHSGRRVNLDRGFSRYVETPLFGSLFDTQMKTVDSILEQQKKTPFYLYFHSNALHFNFYFPKERIAGIPRLRQRLGDFKTARSGALIFNARKKGLSAELVWTAYAEQLRYIDDELGKLFDKMEKRGLEDTIVVLYANHGVDIDQQRKLSVGLPYKNYLHVPLLIRHPKVRTARRIKGMASLVDLAATIYEILGISPSVRLTTYSMVPLIAQGRYAREFAFSKDIQYESVRNAEWKLIIAGGVNRSLYNLIQDPEEKEDIYTPGMPAARTLSSALIRKQLQQMEYATELSRTYRKTEFH